MGESKPADRCLNRAARRICFPPLGASPLSPQNRCRFYRLADLGHFSTPHILTIPVFPHKNFPSQDALHKMRISGAAELGIGRHQFFGACRVKHNLIERVGAELPDREHLSLAEHRVPHAVTRGKALTGRRWRFCGGRAGMPAGIRRIRTGRTGAGGT